MSRSFLLACGGTAGHISPALAIADEIRKTMPDAKIIFVGAGRELERRLIPRAGYHVVHIKMSGLRRDISPKGIMHNVGTLRNLATAGAKAEELIRRVKPDAVIGTGGYICYPVLRKAAQMGVPTLVHESNAVPGLTTKMLGASVDKVLVSFPGLERLYRKPERVVFTGTPVRHGFVTRGDSSGPSRTGDRPLVVSFWGSLGAEHMNEMMVEFIWHNCETRLFDHIHAAGKSGGAEHIIGRLKEHGLTGGPPDGIDIREYIDDMHSVMEAADIVMCRAGGATISEVTAMGKPTVFIPSPYLPGNQQVENAKQVEKAGGAVVLQESECSGKMLYDTIAALLRDKERLGAMAASQRKLGAPDAAEKIINIALELCNKGGVTQ